MALPSRSYTDLSFTCKINPIKKDLTLLKDENAIKRALINLFLYKKGEKPFEPTFGSAIPEYLFEVFDFATAALISDEVTRLIQTFEPRVTLQDLEVVPDFDTNEYEIAIAYTIPNNAQRFDITLNLSSPAP